MNPLEPNQSQALRITVYSAADDRHVELSCFQVTRLDEERRSSENRVHDESFYCTSDEPFLPGESLACQILMPTTGGGIAERNLVFGCRLRVLRVALKGLEPGFRIEFLFENRKALAD